MNTLEVLRAAREYISDPARWFKGDYTDDVTGVAVCAVGACVYHGANHWDIRSALDVAVPEFWVNAAEREGASPITSYNDRPETTHADIMAVFDRAIAIEEAKAAEFTATPEPAPLVAA